MTVDSLHLTAADRVLAIAPHPDDESIACGGLLLAARDAGAARRVVTLTDGDNNPWPQRWIEKRWRIDDSARARWGARRRAEAQAALDVLGVASDQRRFLGLPDAGLTALLMQQPDKLVAPLREEIADFKPTLLVMPALDDAHPDHSAAHIATRVALAAIPQTTARLLTYSIHGTTAAGADIEIALSAAQMREKQRAILCHETQMRLSRSRFLAFAGEKEIHRTESAVSVARGDFPLRVRFGEAGALELHLTLRRRPRGELRGQRLLLLFESGDGALLRWQMPLPTDSRATRIVDVSSGRAVGTALWQPKGNALETAIALPAGFCARLGYAKLARSRAGLVIYDRYGWRVIEIPTRN
jgi:LmbE family N-acetylglucosaminyl deacetylase